MTIINCGRFANVIFNVEGILCVMLTYVLFIDIGRRLNVKIEFLTEPNFIAVYENAIKVTADGPREPRRKFCTLVHYCMDPVHHGMAV